MKRLLVILFILISALTSVDSLTILVEEKLDAPRDRNGRTTFLGNEILYLRNGDLIISNTNASNVFVLRGSEWEPLIKSYRLEAYNNLKEREMGHRGSILLLDSNSSNEYFLSIQARPLPAEYYRIYVNEKGETKAEWVDEAYYKSHRKVYDLSNPPIIETSITHTYDLREGYTLVVTPDDESELMFSAEITDRKGNVVYCVDEKFLYGRIQTTNYVAVNPEKDKIALIITYRPFEWSHYVDELIILKLDYGYELRQGIINDQNVRLREAPNLTGKQLRLLNKGTQVTIEEETLETMKIGELNSVWYKVKLESGESGWVYGAYVEIK